MYVQLKCIIIHFLSKLIFYFIEFKKWSERRDLNPRPLDPQSSALPSCATLRVRVKRLNDCFFKGKRKNKQNKI